MRIFRDFLSGYGGRGKAKRENTRAEFYYIVWEIWKRCDDIGERAYDRALWPPAMDRPVSVTLIQQKSGLKSTLK